MNKHFLKSISIAFSAMIFTLGFVACDKESLSTNDTTVNAVDETIYALEQRGNLGRHGCYDLIFPVTIKFTDGTTKTVTNQDSLRKAVKAWHLATGTTKRDRPGFVYPIQITAEDGSLITVNTDAELADLKAACKKRGLDSLFHRDSLHHKGFPKHDSICFTFAFPISVKKADGTVITISNVTELKTVLHAEKKGGRGHGRKHGVLHQLEIVFPVTVTKADGSTAVINDKDALKALRESCH